MTLECDKIDSNFRLSKLLIFVNITYSIGGAALASIVGEFDNSEDSKIISILFLIILTRD